MASNLVLDATRLNHAIKIMHPGSRGPFTSAEIAAAVSTGRSWDDGKAIHSPLPLREEEVNALRAGHEIIDTAEKLEAIAVHLMLPSAYFSDEVLSGKIDEEMRIVELLRITGVRHLHACRGELTRSQLIATLEKVELEDSRIRSSTDA